MFEGGVAAYTPNKCLLSPCTPLSLFHHLFPLFSHVAVHIPALPVFFPCFPLSYSSFPFTTSSFYLIILSLHFACNPVSGFGTDCSPVSCFFFSFSFFAKLLLSLSFALAMCLLLLRTSQSPHATAKFGDLSFSH